MKRITPLLALLLVFSAGCNLGNSPDNPKDVLTNFFKAISKKDIQDAKKYVTKDSEGMINMMQMSLGSVEDSANTDIFNLNKINIGNAQIDGEEAQIPVTEKATNETMNFFLKKENGKWKVAFDLATLARMAKEKMKDSGFDSGNLDSLMNNVPPEKLEKAQKALDSLSEHLNKIPKEKLSEAQKMLDSLKKLKN